MAGRKSGGKDWLGKCFRLRKKLRKIQSIFPITAVQKKEVVIFQKIPVILCKEGIHGSIHGVYSLNPAAGDPGRTDTCPQERKKYQKQQTHSAGHTSFDFHSLAPSAAQCADTVHWETAENLNTVALTCDL